MRYPILLLMIACGSPEYREQPQPRRPVQPSPGGDDDPSWASVQKVTGAFCAGCHATSPFMQNETAFFKSSAVQKVRNGSMPPQGSAVYSDWIANPGLRKVILDYAELR